MSLGQNQIEDPVQNLELKSELLLKARLHEQPILVFDDDNIVYGVMNNTSNTVIILGPITFQTLTNVELQKYANYGGGIENADFRIVKRTISELCACLSSLYFVRTGMQISEINMIANVESNGKERLNLISVKEHQQYRLDIEDDEIIRLGYSDEYCFCNKLERVTCKVFCKETYQRVVKTA